MSFFAQTEEITTQGFWQAVNQTYRDTVSVIDPPQSLKVAADFLNKKCETRLLPKSLSPYLKQEAEYWKNNYGIELRGGLTSGDLDSSDIDEQGTTYVELSWDVLSRGYKEFQHRSKDLKRKAQLEKVLAKIRAQTYEYRCREFQINHQFDGALYSLKYSLLSLMEKIYAVEEQAYFEGNSYFDELLLSEEAVITLRHQIALLDTQSLNALTAVINPPLIDIKIQQILSSSEFDSRLYSAQRLQRENIIDDNPYRDGSRLRLFVRKELDILASDRDDIIAGLRFSMPLTFKDRPDESFKLQQLERESLLDWHERKNRTIAAYHSFQEQLQRVITQQYRYRRSKERIRRVLSKQATNEQLRPSAVGTRIKTFAESAIELIEAKRELYIRVNNIFLVSQVEFSPALIKAAPTAKNATRHRPYQRAMYIWSSTFNQLSNDQLQLLLKTKQIERPIISASKNTNLVKLEEFVQRFRQQEQQVELMFSSNSWIEPSKHESAIQRIREMTKLSKYIHLDVEPQVMPDYDLNKLAMQQQYIDLIGNVKRAFPDTQLSISVPFHWNQTTYESLNHVVEKFYVMLYETSDLSLISRRIEALRESIPDKKLAIAFRADDFANEYLLEKMIRNVAKEGIESFAIHDLNGVVEWEKN